MKNNSLPPALVKTLLLLCLTYVIFPFHAQGQQNTDNTINGYDVKKLRDNMKSEGMSEEVIDQLIERIKSGKNLSWDQVINPTPPVPNKDKGTSPNPVPFAACSDMGVENGWSSWLGTPGRYASVDLGTTPSVWTWGVPTGQGAPAAPRFTLTSGAGIDPCTPGGGGPPLPVVAPGFGNTSIRLGEPQTTGCLGGCSANGNCMPTGYTNPAGCTEKLNFPLTVGPSDTNFMFAYAIVMQNPGHPVNDQPNVGLCIYDGAGNPIPCGCFKYVADASLPGFYTGICGAGPTTYPIYPLYKSWTIVGVNLSAYQGSTLNVEIINADCSQQGHYTHSYWDFKCGSFATNTYTVCAGQPITLTAPSDPLIAYTYQWSNGAVSSSIVISPQQTTTLTVATIAPSGCKFYIPYQVNVRSVTADFSSSGTCGNMNFTNTSTASTGTPVTAWNWTFQGATPASSTQQNPSVIYSAGGTYSVTLIATSQDGCKDTVTKTISVTPPIVATPTAVPGNCGINASASVSVTGGTPSFTYAWSNAQATQNISGLVTGTYSVLITDSRGCTQTASVNVTATPAVTATITPTHIYCPEQNAPPQGAAALSVLTGTGPYTYQWNNAQTGPTATGLGQGTYTVTVTDANGCTTVRTQTILSSGGKPTAFIPSTAACLGSVTTLTDGSIITGSDPITAWLWSMPGGTPASSASQNASTTYSSAGTYNVTLIVTTQSGCKDTATVQILVYTPPQANFSGTAQGCAPLCVPQFTDASTSSEGNITLWQWSFPGGTPSSDTSRNPTNICYNAPGTYSVALTVTSQYGCKHTATLPGVVTAVAKPKADFCINPEKAPIANPVFNFCDMWSSDVVKWTWYFGDGTVDSSKTDPTHSYSALVNSNDFYEFTVCINVKNQYGCWDTICKRIELLPEFTFYIPNSFTPNDDATNNWFFGKGRGIKDYHISIFDRWGNLIWDCKKSGKNTDWDNTGQDGLSSACQWNGKVESGGMDMSGSSGQLTQEDVYVWKVWLTDVFDKKHTYIGHVSVIR